MKKAEAESLLSRMGDSFQAKFAKVGSWSKSPEADTSAAVWGLCVKQHGAYIWHRSGNIVFKVENTNSGILGAARRDVVSVEIVLPGEQWEPHRRDRLVYGDNLFRDGPWWDWISDFANGVDARVSERRKKTISENVAALEAERALGIDLAKSWTP